MCWFSLINAKCVYHGKVDWIFGEEKTTIDVPNSLWLIAKRLPMKRRFHSGRNGNAHLNGKRPTEKLKRERTPDIKWVLYPFIPTGWWFGTWLLFFHILEIIIPTDQCKSTINGHFQ